MSTREELIATNNTLDEIKSMINADSIAFISIKGLIKSIGIDESNLCVGCLTGKYRVDIPGEECMQKQMKFDNF
jgi:amidophosphoribosyltransferase